MNTLRRTLWLPPAGRAGRGAGRRPGRHAVPHMGLEATPEVIEADPEVGYRATIWEPGGRRVTPIRLARPGLG